MGIPPEGNLIQQLALIPVVRELNVAVGAQPVVGGLPGRTRIEVPRVHAAPPCTQAAQGKGAGHADDFVRQAPHVTHAVQEGDLDDATAGMRVPCELAGKLGTYVGQLDRLKPSGRLRRGERPPCQEATIQLARLPLDEIRAEGRDDLA